MHLQYRGRYPDADASVVHKTYARAANDSLVVSTDWVNTTVATAITANALQTPTYVNTQDALRAHKTAVDDADDLYVPTTALGQPGGLATLDGLHLTASQVPDGVMVNRVAHVYDLANYGTTYLAPGATHTVTTTTTREYKIASISVPDPGYPWIPFPFGVVGGYYNAAPNADRTITTDNLGQIAVMPPSGVSDTIYAAGVCNGVPQRLGYYPFMPHGGLNWTPASVGHVDGPLTLDIYGCCYGVGGYVFSGTGLSFRVLAFPAMR